MQRLHDRDAERLASTIWKVLQSGLSTDGVLWYSLVMAKTAYCTRCRSRPVDPELPPGTHLCAQCLNDLVPGCRICDVVFTPTYPASKEDPTLCHDCYAEQVRTGVLESKPETTRDNAPASEGEPDWLNVPLTDEPLGPEDIEAELLTAMGEGPGPDDLPALFCPPWDEDAPARLARVRAYHSDVASGKPIAFIPRPVGLAPSSTPGGLRPGPEAASIAAVGRF